MADLYKYGSWWIPVPADWLDITESLDDKDTPSTLAKETGVGAFQFSTAEYRSGKTPDITLVDLDALRRDFANRNGFPDAFDEVALDGKMMVSGGSYHAGESLARIWYCSDGLNVFFATYFADWKLRNDEEKEWDGVISLLSFEK